MPDGINVTGVATFSGNVSVGVPLHTRMSLTLIQ